LPEGMPYVSHARQYEIWFSSTYRWIEQRSDAHLFQMTLTFKLVQRHFPRIAGRICRSSTPRRAFLRRA
jgi:hypothetical protein